MKKEFLDCKNIRECVEWYLEETKGKERDAEFELGFIASLYDNYYWDLEDEVLVQRQLLYQSPFRSLLQKAAELPKNKHPKLFPAFCITVP